MVYLLYFYQNGFSYFKMGYASALVWLLMLIILDPNLGHLPHIQGLGLLRIRGAHNEPKHLHAASGAGVNRNQLEKVWRNLPGNIVVFVVLVIGIISMLLPFVWMLSASFKTSEKILTYPPTIWPDPWTLEHYRYVFGDFGYMRFVLQQSHRRLLFDRRPRDLRQPGRLRLSRACASPAATCSSSSC